MDSLWCERVSVIGGAAFFFEYQWVRFATGTIWVSCSVADRSREYGTSKFWVLGGSGGGYGAPCTVFFDLDTPSNGYFDFKGDGEPECFRYQDSGSPENGRLECFGATTDCRIQ